MAIKLTNTKEAAELHGIKVLVYGGSGAGKTRLCGTTGGHPVIISAEAGLLSLAEHDIPVIQVNTIEDVHEAYSFLLSEEGQSYDWVCLDSVTEIAEVVLSDEKRRAKDVRQAYGELAEQMMDLIKAFRDLPGRNVYMSCKMSQAKDDVKGSILFGPMMPGQKLAQQLPYLFDEVLCLRNEKGEDGEIRGWLQTFTDFQYSCKDRSGKLDYYMEPSLQAVRARIAGQQGGQADEQS